MHLGTQRLKGSEMRYGIRPAFKVPGRISSVLVFISLSSPACDSGSPLPSTFTPPQAAFRPVNPPPFWWGVSASSYQTEDHGTGIGENGFMTDWDLYKVRYGGVARDDRVGSYTNFERDLAALKRLGVTHYRFSIEWARVEPSPGAFDDGAIEHYVTVARRLREEGIEPVVCLWHFAFPDWLSDLNQASQHGWLHPLAAESWGEYVTTMSQRLAPYVQFFAPQNEPNGYALGMTMALFPPRQLLSEGYYDVVTEAEIGTFLQAAAIIRAARADAKIISVQNIIHWTRDIFDPVGLYDKALAYNYRHLDGIAGAIDYLGFNYYQTEVASPLPVFLTALRVGANVSDVGMFIDPDGLAIEIVNLSERYQLPLIITENGIADRSDQKRQLFLSSHLQAIRRTLDADYDVRGYFHWTLIDDFEWSNGYGPLYGLHTVDAQSNTLVPKASAELYRSFIAGRVMDPDADPSTLDAAACVVTSER